MNDLTAICIPGSTFSPQLIKASALYFERIYVLDPLPDVSAVNSQLNEIDENLKSMNWDYIFDVAKDNVPFWVTAGLSSDFTALVSTFTVSFILSGVSSIKYIKNREYTEAENQRAVLLERKKHWSDIEQLADHGIVESIAPQIKSKYSSVILKKAETNPSHEELKIDDFANLYHGRKEIDLPNALIDLKQQIALIMEAHIRNAVIVTDNPALNRVIASLLSSFYRESNQDVIVSNFMNAIVNRGVHGLNAFISVLPGISELSTNSILQLRRKHEAGLKHLRREIININESETLNDSLNRLEVIKAAVRNVEASLKWDLGKSPSISYQFPGALSPINTVFWCKK